MSNEAWAVLVCIAVAAVGPVIGMPWLVLVAFFIIGPWLLGRRTKVERLREKRDAAGLAQLAAHRNNAAGRKEAVSALGSLETPDAIEPLMGAMRDPAPDVRREAAQALGERGDKAARKTIAQALADDEPEVRLAAAQAAGQLGGKAARKTLKAIVVDDQADEDLRVQAARALGQMADERACNALVLALGSRSAMVRWAAASALDDIGWAPVIDAVDDAERSRYWVARRDRTQCVAIGPAAVDHVIWAIDTVGGDEMLRTQVRNWAASTLGEIGDPRAIPALIALLASQEETVRWSAADALATLGWQPTPNENGAAFWAAKGEWDKCVELGAASVGALIQVLATCPVHLTFKPGVLSKGESAARALGEIRDPRAVEPLVRALDGGGWAEATKALVSIGDPRAIAPLERSLRDRHITPSAARTLKEAIAQLKSR